MNGIVLYTDKFYMTGNYFVRDLFCFAESLMCPSELCTKELRKKEEIKRKNETHTLQRKFISQKDHNLWWNHIKGLSVVATLLYIFLSQVNRMIKYC